MRTVKLNLFLRLWPMWITAALIAQMFVTALLASVVARAVFNYRGEPSNTVLAVYFFCNLGLALLIVRLIFRRYKFTD